MARGENRKQGFRRADALLQRSIRTAAESRGFAVSRLLTHWNEIAGAEIAAVARPANVSHGRQGFGATLTLLTTGAQAPMVEMQKETLRERVNAAYGYNAIARIRITQTAPEGFAEGRATFDTAGRPDSSPARPQPAPHAQREAARLAAPVGDDSLRAALEALGRNVLSKTQR
ncbi:DUF721 domain-containing protein [Roseovarius salinarum]|uniref:DUF721 domain-containing protein n=1 Tax=Roseovarius salinarum TaxID=1981892 RepID=UPI001E31F516|nr:DUF721 domain-containing protein [Roseovarius salinarum]